jgi:hypothetical protein
MLVTSTPEPKINVCLTGHGIVCGLTVHVNANCDIEIESGTAISKKGTLIKIDKKTFSAYLNVPSMAVQQYFSHDFKDKKKGDRAVLELTTATKYDPKIMDSLKQQSPKDLPTRDVLTDKIMVVLLNEDKPTEQYFILVNPTLLLEKGDPAILKKVKELSKAEITETRTGIFKRPQKTMASYSNEVIEMALYPFLELDEVYLPRFGYKKLAIIDAGKPFGTDNFQNPFIKITKFQHIFDEYKAIIDEVIPLFVAALEKLHTIYGSQLSHKGELYWSKYRDILQRKWQVFLEEGEHLYYVQYFYDWLSDMIKAYDELREKLSAFAAKCFCTAELDKIKKNPYFIVQLGPVLGGRTNYTPSVFRDYFAQTLAHGNNAEQWNEICFLHWRLMMMIWTFDLPQLKLDEKVLVKGGYIVPATEFQDSTNYFEKTDANQDKKIDLEDLPLKFTPSQTPDTLLGEQAIPYYYPLDADSPYSVHRYWNYRLAQMKRIQHIRSYNAIDDKDSYTFIKENKYHKDSQFPLAFNLLNYPFFRAEGHIGKVLAVVEETINGVKNFNADVFRWQELIEKYNLTLQVIAIPMNKITKSALGKRIYINKAINVGLEHIGGLEHGQTLVLVYADSNEQIELKECLKDSKPEIMKYTIVADFTIPFMQIEK